MTARLMPITNHKLITNRSSEIEPSQHKQPITHIPITSLNLRIEPIDTWIILLNIHITNLNRFTKTHTVHNKQWLIRKTTQDTNKESVKTKYQILFACGIVDVRSTYRRTKSSGHIHQLAQRNTNVCSWKVRCALPKYMRWRFLHVGVISGRMGGWR